MGNYSLPRTATPNQFALGRFEACQIMLKNRKPTGRLFIVSIFVHVPMKDDSELKSSKVAQRPSSYSNLMNECPLPEDVGILLSCHPLTVPQLLLLLKY